MADIQGQVLYSWEAAEFSRSDRGQHWHWWNYSVAVLLAVVMIVIHQWVLLAVIVMGTIVLWLLGRSQPREFKHAILTSGIMVGERVWPYGDLRSFWIVSTDIGSTLRVALGRKYTTGLTLQLGSADVEKIRTTLSAYLPEEAGRDEDLVDRVGRFLKF